MLGFEWTSHSQSSPDHHPQLLLSDVVENIHHHNNHHHRHHDLNHNHNYNVNINNNNNNNNNSNNYANDHMSSQSTDQHNRQMFDDPFNNSYTFQQDNNTQNHSNNNNINNNNNNLFYQSQLFNDPRAYQSASYPTANPSMFTLDALSGPTGFNHVIPKTEPDPNNRPIGLNLGGRTYFSPDDDMVSRLYRRSRSADVAINTPKCQAEGCNADLSNAKHYHRRHKVCEFHSKASTVIAAGLIQRFCQQCSRFHLLAEFDNGKRSCRKRLADHNRRRRKSNQMATQDNRMASPMSSENARTSPSQRSPTSNSGINSSSSVTVARSPPQVSFDSSLRERLY